MTENEAEIKRVINYIRSCRNAGIDVTITIDKNRSHFILNALEEIQKYHALGSIEAIKFALFEADKMDEELREYRQIGTLDECREAVEKQKPKKPVQGEPYTWIDTIRERGRYVNVKKQSYQKACPCCDDTVLKGTLFCRKCGQAIDWSDE